MIVFVSFAKNDVTLDIGATNKVADIKQQIQDYTGQAPEEQQLIFAGKKLEDDSDVTDLRIGAGDTLQLVLPEVVPKTADY